MGVTIIPEADWTDDDRAAFVELRQRVAADAQLGGAQKATPDRAALVDLLSDRQRVATALAGLPDNVVERLGAALTQVDNSLGQGPAARTTADRPLD